MYRARPSARAVVHTHSTYSVAVSCMRDTNPDNAIPPLTAYYAMRVGKLPLLPYHAPGDPALGPLAEVAAADHHALLLANHGPIVAAADLASAADALEELEETAKLHLLLQGHPTSPVQRCRGGQISETSTDDDHRNLHGPDRRRCATPSPRTSSRTELRSWRLSECLPRMLGWCPNPRSPQTCGDIPRTACCACPGRHGDRPRNRHPSARSPSSTHRHDGHGLLAEP